MLYGKPTKHVRHVDEDQFTIEPQRFYVHTFWKNSDAATARSDGQDLQDSKTCPSGSVIRKHKVDILVTPETIEPQQIYIGRIKLSFNDILSEHLNGVTMSQTTYQGAVTKANVASPRGPHLFGSVGNHVVNGDEASNQEIGGTASGEGIKEFLLDDHIKHYINLKKVTVFDQRPLLGSRWQRIPSKVKRINPYTFYGLYIFNDSTRGATPANTQVTVNIKSYWEETAI